MSSAPKHHRITHQRGAMCAFVGALLGSLILAALHSSWWLAVTTAASLALMDATLRKRPAAAPLRIRPRRSQPTRRNS